MNTLISKTTTNLMRISPNQVSMQLSRTSRLRLNTVSLSLKRDYTSPEKLTAFVEKAQLSHASRLRLSHNSLALNDENSPPPVPMLPEKSSLREYMFYVEVVVKDILDAFPTFSVLSALLLILKRKRCVCMLKSILAVEKRVNVQFKDNQLKVRSIMIKRNNPISIHVFLLARAANRRYRTKTLGLFLFIIIDRTFS
ncbi:hypothetical protein E3N88_30559 [Mikania micrantha]|uniref:Uncharacterized protein n=1 Tax=Mikania micrantha TaxID=192012 RepID=A0A5N6MM04_9ASTR|nr:hypothetical protein E3N88_30559 [Mikania micrantha]